MAGRAILTLLPVIGVLGYLDTVPLVAWSSKRLRYFVFLNDHLVETYSLWAQLSRIEQSISGPTV